MSQGPRPEPVSEWLAKLDEDGAYTDMVRAEGERQASRAARFRLIEAPIVADLAEVGVDVDSVWDLVNAPGGYAHALPVLLGHLHRGGYGDEVMEGLGRVFATRDGAPYFSELCALYKQARGEGEAEGLAIAIAGAASPRNLPELIDLASDTSLGPSRVFLLRPIGRLGRVRRRELLAAFLADPDLRVEAERLLKQGKPAAGSAHDSR